MKEMYSPSIIVLRMSKHNLEHSDWWPLMFLLSFSSLKVGIDIDFSLASVMSLAVMYVTCRQSLKVSAFPSFFVGPLGNLGTIKLHASHLAVSSFKEKSEQSPLNYP